MLIPSNKNGNASILRFFSLQILIEYNYSGMQVELCYEYQQSWNIQNLSGKTTGKRICGKTTGGVTCQVTTWAFHQTDILNRA